MDYKYVLFLASLLTIVHTAAIPEVYEDSQKLDTNEPPKFNFQEYKKNVQQNMQQMRYLQQQEVDKKNIPLAREAKYVNDQLHEGSHNTPVRVPVQSGWKVVHPKFVNENSQENFPFVSKDKSQEKTKVDINKISFKSENLTTEKPRIFKKSLRPNSYHVVEDEDIQSNDDLERQDSIAQHNYVIVNPNTLDYGGKPKILQQNLGGFVGNQPDAQLRALNSLIGQQPNMQIRGLQRLLTNKLLYKTKDHTPIKEEVDDVPNTQMKPNVKVEHVPKHMLDAIQSLSKSGGGNNPDALKSLQAQLDATANAHAETILAQAQQKAIEHVKAQHAAIARVQAEAEKAAMFQIHAQNSALVNAQSMAATQKQAEFEARESEVEAARQAQIAEARLHAERERKDKEDIWRQNERSRKAERAREQARRTLKKENKPKTKVIAVKSKPQLQHSSETQQHYITQAAPIHLESLDQHQHAYKDYGSGGEADVNKYYVQPQFTVQDGKNVQGEPELQYAAKYAFGYRIRDAHHGNDFGHEESKDGETTKGHYHVLLPDGRIQNVNYYVDPSGYHAEVSYGGGAEAHHRL